MTTTYQNRQNGKAPPPDNYGAGEIETQYRNCAEILFAAILREPHNFALYAAKMNPVWWEDTQFKKAAIAVFEQAGNYSVRSVCIAAGIETDTERMLNQPGGQKLEQLYEAWIYQLMQTHAETDVELALSIFEPTYRLWVEYRCAQFVQHGAFQGWEAEKIRDEQDKFRNDRAAYVTATDTTDVWYEEWFEKKMRNEETNYPCKPSLNTVIKNRLNVGFEPGVYYLRAARTGMGKTTLTLNDLLRFDKEGARGVFLTLDMNIRLMKIRLIGMITGYTQDDDWTLLTDEQRQTIYDAKKYVDGMNVVWINNTNDVNELISICRAEHYKAPIDYLIIDYIQKLKDSGIGKGVSRTNEIGDINTKLKLLANALNIPVIALAQILQDVERRGGNGRPTLADLRDSGTLADDADVVEMIYRPDKYGIEESEQGDSLIGRAEIIYAKQRMRKPDSAWVDYDGLRGFSDTDETNHDQGRTIQVFVRPGIDDENSIPF